MPREALFHARTRDHREGPPTCTQIQWTGELEPDTANNRNGVLRATEAQSQCVLSFGVFRDTPRPRQTYRCHGRASGALTVEGGNLRHGPRHQDTDGVCVMVLRAGTVILPCKGCCNGSLRHNHRCGARVAAFLLPPLSRSPPPTRGWRRRRRLRALPCCAVPYARAPPLVRWPKPRSPAWSPKARWEMWAQAARWSESLIRLAQVLDVMTRPCV